MLIYKIDLNNRFEYNILLRTTDMKVINQIDNKYITAMNLKFNDKSSISLSIPKYIKNQLMEDIENPLYRQIGKNKIITVDDKYAFIIRSFQEKEQGTLNCKKILSNILTLEETLQRKTISLGAMTRQIKKDDTDASDGIIDFLERKTRWKLGYLDKDAQCDYINGGYSKKYRNLESQDKTWYNFIKTDCVSAFRSLWMFNSFNRTIDIYDEKNLGTHTGLWLDSNFIKDVTKDVNNDNVITRLKVIGQDNLTIAPVNPLGTEYIEDFSAYKDDMSPELSVALDKYNSILEINHSLWIQKRSELATKRDEKNRINEQIVKIKEQLKGLKGLQTAYIKANDNENLSRVTAEYNQKEQELNNCLSNLSVVNGQIEVLENDIKVISEKTNKHTCTDDNGNKVFDDILLDELDLYIIEDSWQNSAYANEEALFKAGVDELKDKQIPLIEFSVSTVDFLQGVKNKEFWDKKLRLGDFVTIETNNFGNVDVRLIGIDHTPSSNSLKLIFSNKVTKYQPINISNTVTSNNEHNVILNKNKNLWEQGVKESTDFVKELREQGLDLASAMVNGRTPTNRIFIDNYGIMIEDVENVGAMLYISSGLIAISDDGFKTSKTAIDKNGVIAKHIVGELLLGEKLFIADKKGVIKIEDGKITVKDSSGRIRVLLGLDDKGVAGLKLYSADGREVVLDERGMINRYYQHLWDNLDSNNPMIVPLDFDEGINSIRSFKIRIKPERFRSYSKGVSGGGGVIGSTGGSGMAVTSTNGGGSYTGSSSTVSGGGHSETYTSGSEWWHGGTNEFRTGWQKADTGGNHYHTTMPSLLRHDHRITVRVPSHSHSFSVEVPDHIHTLNISEHNHSVHIPDHVHEMQHGIFQGAKASNVYIKVNGQTVQQGINSETVLDIASYLNAQSLNTIEIGSSSIGRIDISISAKIFTNY